MKIRFIKTLTGHKPLFQDNKSLFTVRKKTIYQIDLQSLSFREIAKIPTSIIFHLISSSRLISRLLRLDTYCCIKIDDNHLIVSDKNIIYNVNTLDCTLKLELKNPPGSKPFSFCSISNIDGFDDMICYGEYVKIPSEKPVKIIGRDSAGNWVCLHNFSKGEVGHVHSLAPDPYRNCIWIFTGDYGDTAAIWCATDNFKHVKCILKGKQQYRASVGYPLEEGILYATDSHLERNSICILYVKKNSISVESLYDLNGSCIYSMKLGNEFIFSTAYEPDKPSGNIIYDLIDVKPGPGILSDYCDVVAGNVERGFENILRWKVDKWPKRLFQFSTIIFPFSTSSNNYLPIYGQGCIGHDDKTELYTII